MLVVQISQRVQQAVQFTTLVLVHTLLQSHLYSSTCSRKIQRSFCRKVISSIFNQKFSPFCSTWLGSKPKSLWLVPWKYSIIDYLYWCNFGKKAPYLDTIFIGSTICLHQTEGPIWLQHLECCIKHNVNNTLTFRTWIYNIFHYLLDQLRTYYVQTMQ